MAGRYKIRSALFSVWAACLLSCAQDYSIDLPNGYKLAKTAGSTYIIADAENRVVVGPSVEKYQVAGESVFGYLVSESDSAHFWIDTTTNRVEVGLNFSDVEGRLERLGFEKKVKLRRPTKPKS